LDAPIGTFTAIAPVASLYILRECIMKAALLAISALIAMSAGSAEAADLPVYKAPPAPIATWTGFYVGGDVGGFLAHQYGNASPFPAGFAAPPVLGAGFAGIGVLPTAHGLNNGSVLAGVHAGYNWQVKNWLLGFEGDVTWLNRRSSDTELTFDSFGVTRPDGTMRLAANNDWLASARARVGWIGGPWMVYLTGGAAWTKTSQTATWTPIPGALFPIPSTSSVAFDANKTGYVVGIGGEWMLKSNWSVRAEYLHYEFDGASGSVPFVVPVGNGCTPVGTCGWNVSSSRLQLDTLRLGLSYKFGAVVN
jgi:outer membrane immunogenic protein